MKLTLGLLLLTTLASCGVGNHLSEKCGSDLESGCNFIFGYKDKDQDAAIAANAKKNDEQDARLNILEAQNDSLHRTIDDMSLQIEELSDNVEVNADDISDLRVTISSLQNQITANLIQMNALSGSLAGAITSMIDVCGDQSGHFDEVILKTANGKYIAYFEDGGKRFLTVIGAGNFTTTDFQRCNFTISNTGVLTF